jgi:hypothetical protein
VLRASLRDAELVRLGRLLDFQTFRLSDWNLGPWNGTQLWSLRCCFCCCWREPENLSGLTVAAVRRPLDLHLLFTSPLAVCMLQC